MTSIKTTCCITGGGPAGMMLGFLLARAGVPIIVLEKHKDFLRDFRGDTVHPIDARNDSRARIARGIPQNSAFDVAGNVSTNR